MGKTKHMVHRRKPRKLEELNLLDDFLFQEMVTRKETGEEFCRILLGTILGRQIRRVRIVSQKNILGVDTDRHGIRMDAYIEEIGERSTIENAAVCDAEIVSDIYDVEPNNTYEKETLPRRMRYYHALIDTKLLECGVEYEKLPKVVAIVILPYDPFGRNRMVYTIANQCMEDNTVAYDDGAKKIFLYTRGIEGNPSQELRDMLKYMEKTTDDNVTNQNIASIHGLVNQIKKNKEVGINYMKSWEREKMIREEGIEEGFEQGIEEGIEQGIEQGIAALIETCRELEVSKEDTLQKVIEKFSLPEEKAVHYLEEQWR